MINNYLAFETKNSLTLAYLGDAVYEIYIREYLINQGIVKVNDLQREATKFVSANNQSKHVNKMIQNNFFNEQEINIIKRARNHKGSSHPKNTNVIAYKWATGLEALIGYLYLIKNEKRITEIINYIVGD